MIFQIESRYYTGYGANLRVMRGTRKIDRVEASSVTEAKAIWRKTNPDGLRAGRLIERVRDESEKIIKGSR